MLDYIKTCLVTPEEFLATQHMLIPEISRLIDAQYQQYDTDYAAINLPNDQKKIAHIKNIASTTLLLQPTTLIVIGIGGSNLGTAAIVQALFGTLYNENMSIKVYYADTVDTDYIAHILRIAEKELISGNAIIVNAISKSGTTTETIANFQLFLELLQKYRPHDYQKYIVITTDKNSLLYNFAKQNNINTLIIPAEVGGRYSVFSAVGLFPLALLGVDIDQLCAGAHSALQLCIQPDYEHNPAAISAIILHLLYKKGFVVYNLFLFSTALENLGKWYRQLVAESIGKIYDKNNNVIHNGILPTVSIGSTDLHSIAQHYLSGPYNIFTTFISIEKNAQELFINKNIEFYNIAPDIQHRSLTTIMNAILEGTKIAYQNEKRPYIHMTIAEKNSFYIGQCMQIKMFEIMYLGFLMNINPFDQPQVELYKKETKSILKQS